MEIKVNIDFKKNKPVVGITISDVSLDASHALMREDHDKDYGSYFLEMWSKIGEELNKQIIEVVEGHSHKCDECEESSQSPLDAFLEGLTSGKMSVESNDKELKKTISQLLKVFEKIVKD